MPTQNKFIMVKQNKNKIARTTYYRQAHICPVNDHADKRIYSINKRKETKKKTHKNKPENVSFIVDDDDDDCVQFNCKIEHFFLKMRPVFG